MKGNYKSRYDKEFITNKKNYTIWGKIAGTLCQNDIVVSRSNCNENFKNLMAISIVEISFKSKYFGSIILK